MGIHMLSVGSLVYVTSYSPFRGLRGTIRTVHTMAPDLDEPFCFYLVALEEARVREPVWFEYDEVEPIASSLGTLQVHDTLTSLNLIGGLLSQHMPSHPHFTSPGPCSRESTRNKALGKGMRRDVTGRTTCVEIAHDPQGSGDVAASGYERERTFGSIEGWRGGIEKQEEGRRRTRMRQALRCMYGLKGVPCGNL
jgi:hypothetical protein